MYCEECEKRPANVHITKIVNGHKVERHLCEQCAKKQQDVLGFTLIPDFTLSNFLTSMLDGESFAAFGNKNQRDLKCDKCSMTYSQFTKGGRLGCDHCYGLYGDQLEHLLKRIHGTAQHTGKIPKRNGVDILLKQELEKARIELQKAVLNEEFEQAAKLRDKIKELEKRKNNSGGEVND
jgi:protein arginine kinase activator